ncbi:MAG: polyprenyl synthetase family protein [Candidatus Saccharimonas sp.]|nr:polyprenyl synthetase family protein [Candidatus Saccharimonas sp.]
MTQPFTPNSVRFLVDERIKQVINQRIEQASDIHPRVTQFWQVILDTILSGGKRMRPYLTVVGCGQVTDDSIAVAAAQELLHCAMLIHDDIIDKDYVRHGHKNVSGMYLDSYLEFTNKSNAVHFANSAAILAGDALLSEAYQLIHSTNFSSDIKRKLNDEMGRSIFEVIGGELLDVESSFMTELGIDPVDVYRYKTASYSFIGPLLSGVYCSNYPESLNEGIENIAKNMGIAFQVQDDLIGVFGDEQKTGKSTVSDLKEGKQTILVKYHQKLMNDVQRQRFSASFGNSKSQDDDFFALKKDMTESGAKDLTETYANDCFNKASDAIRTIKDPELSKRLLGLVEMLRTRSY